MTILVPYRGIIEIVGEHDTGKTIAALQTVYPYKDVVFVDDDVKGDGTVKQMGDKDLEYINLGEARAGLGDAPSYDELLFNIVVPTIQKIVSKKRKVIIWDTWRIVYQSARGHVLRNKSKYNHLVDLQNDGKSWVGTKEIIQGLVSRIARDIERNQLLKLKDACELLIITHHIKDKYSQSGIASGTVPESSKTFDEVCNMRMWLRRNVYSKVPVILFLKRPSVPVIVKGKPKFKNIVPEKITPTAKDESIWDAIKRYEDEPFESRELRQDEIPTEEEKASIMGTFSKEQQKYIEMVMKYQTSQVEELSEIVSNGHYPKSKIEFMNMAQSQFDMDMNKVSEVLGKKTKDIDLVKDWDILKEKAGK